MLRLVSFFAAILAVQGQSTSVSQCTANPGSLPTNTYIEGCSTPPCLLPQLQDAVINIQFQAPRDISSMTTLATAYLRVGLISIPVPYDLLENALTCNFLQDASCPVNEGDVLDYTLKMYIEPIFPVGIQVTVEFRVVDENNAPVFCIRLPITIGAPVNKAGIAAGN